MARFSFLQQYLGDMHYLIHCVLLIFYIADTFQPFHGKYIVLTSLLIRSSQMVEEYPASRCWWRLVWAISLFMGAICYSTHQMLWKTHKNTWVIFTCPNERTVSLHIRGGFKMYAALVYETEDIPHSGERTTSCFNGEQSG